MENYCPNCGKSGTLTDNPKGVYEGEITCSMKKVVVMLITVDTVEEINGVMVNVKELN